MPFISVVTEVVDSAGVSIAPAGNNVKLGVGSGLSATVQDQGSTQLVTLSATTDAVPVASTTVLGKVKVSVAPESPAQPIAVGDNDTRMAPASAGNTVGDIQTWNGTAWVRIVADTGGFVFTSVSPGAIPIWAAPAVSGSATAVGAYATVHALTPTNGNRIWPTEAGAISMIGDGAAWRPELPGAGLGTSPPLLSNWTQIEASGVTFADDLGAVSIYMPADPGIAPVDHVHGIAIPVPAATNYTVIAGVLVNAGYPVSGHGMAGVGWTDGTSGSSKCIMNEFGDDGGSLLISGAAYYSTLASSTRVVATSGAQYFSVASMVWGQIVYYKLVDDGTTRFAYLCSNRKDWIPLYAVPRTTQFTATHIIIGGNPKLAPVNVRLLSYEPSTP